MASCGKCGADVPPPGRFCGLCGAPTSPPPAPAIVTGPEDTDPLARTAPADPKEIAKFRLSLEAARAANAPAPADPATKPSRARVAPTVNDLVPVPAIGAKVQVEWSDGKKYPGTVKQASTEQCLILFPDGQEQWVELRRVSPG